jgi:hypothetical protein
VLLGKYKQAACCEANNATRVLGVQCMPGAVANGCCLNDHCWQLYRAMLGELRQGLYTCAYSA